MRYARGSFLLGWNGQSGSALIYRPDPDVVDSYSPSGPSTWARPPVGRYAVGAGGVVSSPAAPSWSTPPVGSQTFDLGGVYRMPDGSLVSSVTLGPASALVLRGL